MIILISASQSAHKKLFIFAKARKPIYPFKIHCIYIQLKAKRVNMGKSAFLNEMSRFMRQQGMSLRTEKTYIHWVKRFIRFNKLAHPMDLADADVTRFLSHLANDCNVAINTQKTALNGIAFLYNQFLKRPLGDLGFHYAKQGRRLPDVLSMQEVANVLSFMGDRDRLIFSLLYGSGLRITECLRLRIRAPLLTDCSLCAA
jgi:site-specific recombinase XerD